MGAFERLKLARELAGTIGTLKSETDVLRRVALAKKVQSLRAILRGQKSSSIESLDLHAGRDTVRVLSDYWQSLKDAPELDRMRAARYMDIITKYVASIGSATSMADGSNGSSGIGGLMAVVGDLADKPAARMRAEFDEFMSRAPGIDPASDLEGDKARGMLKVIEDAERSMLDQIRAKIAAFEEETKAERAEAYARMNSETEAEFWARYNAYRDKRQAAIASFEADFDPMVDSLKEQRRHAEMVRDAVGADLKRNVLNASPVSEEAAQTWAHAQKIEASGMSALKKIGYDPAVCRADMAEFYRLTGGRLSKVRIKASRGRASAEGIHGHKNRTINMGAGFCKRTLFHELGHHLEADPGVFAAARAFLVKRRESDAVYRLRDLTGNSAYKRDEVAYKDAWFNPYVGKHYNYDVTEVMSMGVESWCDDATLAARMAADPEHMKLIAGFMKSPPHPLMAAVKKVLGQAADTEAEAADAVESTLEDGLKKLAAGVEFTKRERPEDEGPGQWTGDQPWTPAAPYWIRDGVYLGSFKGIDAWESKKVRDPSTKRQKKGIVLHTYKREGGRTEYRHLSTFSLEEAKATARVWDAEGEPRYLTDYKRVQQLVQAMGAA